MCLSRHHHHHHHHPHSDDFFRGPEGSLRPASPDNPLLWPVLGSSTLLFLFSLPEILSGEMSRSRGLVADGLHNLLDWAGTLPLLFGLWAERRAPSPRFPYGLGKAETLSGLGVLLMVLASAFMTLYLSVRGLFSPSPVREPLLAMGIALASVAVNLLVGGLQISSGRRASHPALLASGHHALTDAGIALGVLAGIAATPLGYPRLDALAGLLLGALLVRSALSGGGALLIRLLDGIDPEVLDTIKREAEAVPGVEEVGEVRARWIGRALAAEIRLTVPDRLDTRQAHQLAQEVRHRLLHRIERLCDLLVHIDPRGESGEAFHRISAHAHDGLPLHSH